jgi:hypothetical protein
LLTSGRLERPPAIGPPHALVVQRVLGTRSACTTPATAHTAAVRGQDGALAVVTAPRDLAWSDHRAGVRVQQQLWRGKADDEILIGRDDGGDVSWCSLDGGL